MKVNPQECLGTLSKSHMKYHSELCSFTKSAWTELAISDNEVSEELVRSMIRKMPTRTHLARVDRAGLEPTTKEL